jgi:ABC-2 type transport system permease protein
MGTGGSMTTEATRPAGALSPPSALSRGYGFGSVFGKTLRDSRWAILVVGLLIGAITVLVAVTVATGYPTQADRAKLAAELTLLPAFFQGILGDPINIETLPGFISWRSLNFAPIFIGIWSILALSGTLAGEAGRGSLELVVAVPQRRSAIALQKVVAHVVGLIVAMTLAATITWLATIVTATLPGDQTSLATSLSHYAWVGVCSLFGGAVAFALGPFLGRSLAAGAAALVLVGSYVINGFAATVSFFDSIRWLSIFSWTGDHRPLAGIVDWPPVLAVAAICVLLLAAGVAGFVLRDVASAMSLRGGIGGGAWSTRGPILRGFSERLPVALSFGLGTGILGFYLAVSAEDLARLFADLPEFTELIGTVFPGIDLATAAGLLQLMFFGFAILLIGLASAVLAAGSWGDERDDRLEMILAAPMTRFAWTLRNGVGTMLAVFVLATAIAVPIAVGAALIGDDALTPSAGVMVLGLYAAALVGVGYAVGGLISPSLAGMAVGIYVVGAFLLEIIGTPLDAPDWLLDLSLARHLGQPMVGTYDAVGMAVCAVLAIGGLVIGSWGFSRRDLSG